MEWKKKTKKETEIKKPLHCFSQNSDPLKCFEFDAFEQQKKAYKRGKNVTFFSLKYSYSMLNIKMFWDLHVNFAFVISSFTEMTFY